MVMMKDVEEILNEICYAPLPYETRAEMCAAVVKAAREAEYERGTAE